MKYEILDIITEAYNNDELSAEDAVAYADFVEYADLNDGDDVEILTEMVDILAYDDDCYMMEKKTDTKNDSKEKKKSKFKAKLANAKAFVSRNKGKIAAGVLGAAGIAGAAGIGYAAGKTGSDRRNSTTIQGLNDALSAKSKKLDETRQLFKQANAAKRYQKDWKDHYRSSSRTAAYAARLAAEQNQKLRTAFKQANAMKRSLKEDNDNLVKRVEIADDRAAEYRNLASKHADTASDRLTELRMLRRENRKLSEREALRNRGDAYRKALSGTGVADSIKNRASGNIDQFKPATPEQIAALQQKLNSNTNKSKSKRKR